MAKETKVIQRRYRLYFPLVPTDSGAMPNAESGKANTESGMPNTDSGREVKIVRHGSGTGVRHPSERVFGMLRNRRSAWPGLRTTSPES